MLKNDDGFFDGLAKLPEHKRGKRKLKMTKDEKRQIKMLQLEAQQEMIQAKIDALIAEQEASLAESGEENFY